MSDDTVNHVSDLVRGLNDSFEYLEEAATKVNDDKVATLFKQLSADRKEIADTLAGMIALASSDADPAEEGSWLGKVRQCWTAFRVGLNSGDATVMLVEAEHAEDAILEKFKDVLPQVAGSEINDVLLQYFAKVKEGHDQVLALRNAYQCK